MVGGDEGPVGDTAERSGTRIGNVRPIKGESGGAGGTVVDCGDDDIAARSGTRITRVFPIRGWALGAGCAGGGGTDFVGPGFGRATVGSVEYDGTGLFDPPGATVGGGGVLGTGGSARKGVAAGGMRGAWGLTAA